MTVVGTATVDVTVSEPLVIVVGTSTLVVTVSEPLVIVTGFSTTLVTVSDPRVEVTVVGTWTVDVTVSEPLVSTTVFSTVDVSVTGSAFCTTVVGTSLVSTCVTTDVSGVLVTVLVFGSGVTVSVAVWSTTDVTTAVTVSVLVTRCVSVAVSVTLSVSRTVVGTGCCWVVVSTTFFVPTRMTDFTGSLVTSRLIRASPTRRPPSMFCVEVTFSSPISPCWSTMTVPDSRVSSSMYSAGKSSGLVVVDTTGPSSSAGPYSITSSIAGLVSSDSTTLASPPVAVNFAI